jgi:putative PIN family toxin of toxin-antitoxin system
VEVVLDTSVLVTAIRSESGASRIILEAALNGSLKIIISNALVFEYEAVLTRPKHLLASGLTSAKVGELIDALCAVATLVPIHQQWRPQLSDQDDEFVLEAAINGRAGAIVTFNREDFLPATVRHGIMVLSPGEALEKAVNR